MSVRKMKCPHCSNKIGLEIDHESSWTYSDEDIIGDGYGLSYGHCPACEKIIVIFLEGTHQYSGTTHFFEETAEEIIYPKYIARTVEAEVPDRFKQDFLEACAVLPVSSKASAALSRRILQDVFREELGIKKPNLAQEIDEFIKKKDIPTYLGDAVDAIRNIGNFAAHPLKDTNTGTIVEVEAGEAEWLLEVNEALFDFVFVQPKRLAERKKNLNAKLKSLGKPPMKKIKPRESENES